jgi:hypothetical protein
MKIDLIQARGGQGRGRGRGTLILMCVLWIDEVAESRQEDEKSQGKHIFQNVASLLPLQFEKDIHLNCRLLEHKYPC